MDIEKLTNNGLWSSAASNLNVPMAFALAITTELRSGSHYLGAFPDSLPFLRRAGYRPIAKVATADAYVVQAPDGEIRVLGWVVVCRLEQLAYALRQGARS